MDKKGYDSSKNGTRIDTLPITGTLTGQWQQSIYGCWWEYVPDQKSPNDNRNIWIIGEYPD